MRVTEADNEPRLPATDVLNPEAGKESGPPVSWEPTDVRACDPEHLVVATLQAFKPAALRRYLQRKATVPRCYEYTPYADGGFKIAVPSHALTIDTVIEPWKEQISTAKLPEPAAAYVRLIDVSTVATFEAGNGDRTRIRCVAAFPVKEE